MLMANVVTDLANRTPGKEAVAMESFAKALRMVSTHSGGGCLSGREGPYFGSLPFSTAALSFRVSLC